MPLKMVIVTKWLPSFDISIRIKIIMRFSFIAFKTQVQTLNAVIIQILKWNCCISISLCNFFSFFDLISVTVVSLFIFFFVNISLNKNYTMDSDFFLSSLHVHQVSCELHVISYTHKEMNSWCQLPSILLSNKERK